MPKPSKRLIFERRVTYGHQRLYPANRAAEALLELIGRKCLDAHFQTHMHATLELFERELGIEICIIE